MYGYDRIDVDGAVDVWEPRASGILSDTRFPPDWDAEPGWIDLEQHQIRASGVEPIRRQVHGSGVRTVDEAILGHRLRGVPTGDPGALPLLVGADMKYHCVDDP